MSVALTIIDETASGTEVERQVIQFPVDYISARQLIEARVKAEVAAFNSRPHDKPTLVEVSHIERLLNQKTLATDALLDEQKHIDIALNAFANMGYFLLVNDQQITDLDQQFFITPKTKVSFIKLLRLVGG